VFTATADLYDVIYRAQKDYRREARQLAKLVRAANPSATTLLDLACGTGEHAAHLRDEQGFSVDGLDLNEHFVELARAKNPDGDFRCGDMTDFDFSKQYDAVACLFGSIGYVVEIAPLRRAIASMARHVAPAGVLIVEPWFAPGVLEHGHVSVVTAEGEGLQVCRMGYTEIEGRLSRLSLEYLIGTAEGIRRESEVHELGLFTRAEMEESFRAVGLTPEFDARGLMGRGLYHAQRDG
jgi:SAM-dependent methyltransferase